MSLNQLLADLQKEYLATFSAKITLIEQLWENQYMVELETEYHKLKGTGRTYGLPEVTLLGEALERLCERRSPQLEKAVLLSLKVLEKIKREREKGQAVNLDADADFTAILQIPS